MMKTWPTKKKPDVKLPYKFASFWLELRQDVTFIERSTYSILEWLGDVGGLFDGLRVLSQLIVTPIAVVFMQKMLV